MMNPPLFVQKMMDEAEKRRQFEENLKEQPAQEPLEQIIEAGEVAAALHDNPWATGLRRRANASKRGTPAAVRRDLTAERGVKVLKHVAANVDGLKPRGSRAKQE